MKHLAHEETYRGCKIELHYDDSPTSPREWDNIGTMVCWHRRYNLGDEQPRGSPDDYIRENIKPSTWVAEKERREQEIRARPPRLDLCGTEEEREDVEQELHDALDKVESEMEDDAELCRQLFEKDNIVLPLYLYDHSGISMSTGKFSCPWDSGQVGFVYCSKERARKEWAGTDDEIYTKAVACMRGEVKDYSAYLEGDVVGFITKAPDGEMLDSCWGFYPDTTAPYSERWADPIGQAKASIDYWHKKQIETATATTACYI